MPATPSTVKQPKVDSPVLKALFGSCPQLRYSFGDIGAYRSLHVQAQHLVSLIDELGKTKDPEVLTLRFNSKALGVVSYFVETNPKRPAPLRKYARIDLVITDPVFRGAGVGRLLMQATLAHLLERNGAELYSISCLAAHDAVAHVLEDLGFEEKQQAARVFEKVSYKHEHLRLDAIDVAAYCEEIVKRTATTLREVNYRLRQKFSPAFRW